MKPIKEGFISKAPSFDGFTPIFTQVPGLNAPPIDYNFIKNKI